MLQLDCFYGQGYVVCPSDKRFLLLFTFLKKNRNKKIMVRILSKYASVVWEELNRLSFFSGVSRKEA